MEAAISVDVAGESVAADLVWSLGVLLIMLSCRPGLGRPILFCASFLSGYMAHRYPVLQVPGRIRSLIPVVGWEKESRWWERKEASPGFPGFHWSFRCSWHTPPAPSTHQPTTLLLSPHSPSFPHSRQQQAHVWNQISSLPPEHSAALNSFPYQTSHSSPTKSDPCLSSPSLHHQVHHHTLAFLRWKLAFVFSDAVLFSVSRFKWFRFTLTPARLPDFLTSFVLLDTRVGFFSHFLRLSLTSCVVRSVVCIQSVRVEPESQ